MGVSFSSIVDKVKRKEILILLLCLMIGFILRFYTFDQKSLWLDEVHTFNDSRDDLKGQIKFYRENPTFLHPPLFFILTHQFYPFTKPEKDLRIIPLIFGTLSIPMIFFLSRLFSPYIALPCTLSLTFMTYHISLSQDGRSYSLLMFLGMASLYFFMKHLSTSKRRYLFLVALFYALSFHTSYSSIPFIFFSQVLWLYQPKKEETKPIKQTFYFFLILNGLTLLLCLPWIIFVVVNYKGQAIMDPSHTESLGSFWSILYGILHDWVPHNPLMIASIILLLFFPFFLNKARNPFVLLTIFILPVGWLYGFCNLLKITHFVTSRYFINFLPLFFVTLYLSLVAIEVKFESLRRFMRLRLLFTIFLVASNLIILPFYYHSEKQDLRGLVNYLKGQLQEGDKIFVEVDGNTPGILHYFRAYPKGRHHVYTGRKISEKDMEFITPFIYKNRVYNIYHYKTCCAQYVADGNQRGLL